MPEPRDVFLLLCMHRTKHRTEATQPLFENIVTDRQLFGFVKAQIKQHHGIFWALSSMRRVKNIYFVKVSLHRRTACI